MIMNILRLMDYGLWQMFPNMGMTGLSYDVQDNDEQIIFTMGVPGMTEEDVEVRIKDGKRLVVKSLRKGKFTPEFHYAFILPCSVIKKETFASIKNGVLTVNLQKAEVNEFKVKLS